MSNGPGTDRIEAAREVTRLLRGNEAFRAWAAANDSGERAIVVALEGDSMESLVKRIEAVGLPVTVCVPRRESRVATLSVKSSSDGLDATTESFTVAPEASVGLFIEYAEKRGVLRIQIAEPCLEMELELAPA